MHYVNMPDFPVSNLPAPFLLRETFHLFFLRVLAESLAGRSYALKGGVCLRLFYSSPRLSEDIDLDIVSIPAVTLKAKIRKILDHRALMEKLKYCGVTGLTATEPKQTETTQRWKIQLLLPGGGSLSTRIECSRRVKTLTGVESEVPSAEILGLHRTIPFVCRHYAPEAMVRQKLEALASPVKNACRDLFDLHHLLTYAKASPQKPAADALEKIGSFRFSHFQEEVLPFLPADLAKHYGKENFEKLRKAVLSLLSKP